LYVATYVLYSSLCFYVKGGDSLAKVTQDTILKAATYPPAIYSFGVKIILFTFIPALFFAFIPAQYILLTFNIWWFLGFIGVVVLWIVLAFLFFKLGLRKYNSGSLMSGRL
jgi:ABC-2 type transport system permease protein